jgi:hypothetical protein
MQVWKSGEIYMNQTLKMFIRALLILIGGIIMVALFWLTYFGLTLLLEATLFRDNPQDLPQDILRNISALLAVVLIFILLSTKLHETIKGMLLLAGIAVFIMALVLRFYMIMWLAIILVAFGSGIIILIFIKKHKSWLYYYALGLGVIIGLLYAWPR